MAKELIIEPNTRCTMEYEDSTGTLTRREVTFKKFEEKDGKLYANAFCHSRNGPRSFRADRIKSFISEDGEVLDISSVEGINAGSKHPQTRTTQKTTRTKKRGFRWRFLMAWYCAAALFAWIGMTGEYPIGKSDAIAIFVVLAAPIFCIDLIIGMFLKRTGINKR